MNDTTTDHDKFYRALAALPGAKCVDQMDVGVAMLGAMGCVDRIEFWTFGGRGVVLLIDDAGRVGVYVFRGASGEPVENDIAILRTLETGIVHPADPCGLGRGRVLGCAFCGVIYYDGTPTDKHEALAAHIRECPEHPVGAEVRRLRDRLHSLGLDPDALPTAEKTV